MCKRIILFILIALGSLSFSSCSQFAVKNMDLTKTRIDAVSEDKWTQINAQAVGMDANALKTLHEDIQKKYPQINSMLILRHGNIVFEEYYNGTDKDSLNQIRSCTKSILSTLMGIAIDRGDIKSLDTLALDYFPEYQTSETDPLISKITVRHLLTMSSGIPYDFNKYMEWVRLDNQIKAALESKPLTEPGKSFRYNDPGVHLLSGILTKATKMKASEYAEQFLFKELDITEYSWPEDNQGNNVGAAELTLRTRDMAKIGQLYLNKGKWKDKQILSEEWVNQATQIQSQGGAPSRASYGYLWWVTKTKGHPAFFAMGYGGQFIYVVPELDMVTVVTSSLEAHHEENRFLVDSAVVPAINE